MVSCATTGGLAYLFADLNGAQTSSRALAALPTPLPASQQPGADAGSASTSAQPGSSTSVATAPTTAVPVPAPAPAPSGRPTSTPTTAAAAPPKTTAAPTTTARPATTGKAAFNGDVVDTPYGPVEVQAQISNGKLIEVAVVEYPTAERKSVRINASALPQLRTEALSAQSANVDTVSGATYTSESYAQSLQSAIDKARAAGATKIA